MKEERRRLISNGSSPSGPLSRSSSEPALNYTSLNGDPGGFPSYQNRDAYLAMGDDDEDVFPTASTGSIGASLSMNDDIREPVSVSWEGVTVNYPGEKKKSCFGLRVKETPPKTILNNMSGVAKPGSVLAVIGASGSGKTVLLNVLTKRNLGGLEVSGEVRVNGRKVSNEIRNISAFSQQQDAFIGQLKVGEHLHFHAQLRLPDSFTFEEKEARVDAVLRELGLSHRADTLIGIPGVMKTLSGGERKRLSFATELLTNPNIILCDEPTTGLDAFMAQGVIQTLKNLAASGRTVITTIHQPASEVFAMFDQLLLLSDGRTAYMGVASDAVTFFKSCGLPCPVDYNPADFFIQTLALIPGKAEQHQKTVQTLCGTYTKSVYFDDIQMEIDLLKDMGNNQKGNADWEFNALMAHEGSAWTTQFSLLVWRSWLAVIRNKKLLYITILQTVITAVFFDIISFRTPLNQEGIQNITGIMFCASMQIGFTIMFAIYTIIPTEKLVFQRDMESRIYKAPIYFMSHVIAEFIPFILQSILFTFVFYWAIGLYESLEAVFTFMACFLLLIMYGSAFGRLVSVAIDDMSIALAVLTIFRNLNVNLGGLFIKISSIPYILKPVAFLTSLFYGGEILSVNQWENVEHISCVSSHNVTQTRCLQTGPQVITSLGYETERLPLDFGILTLLVMGVECLGLVALTLKARKFR